MLVDCCRSLAHDMQRSELSASDPKRTKMRLRKIKDMPSCA